MRSKAMQTCRPLSPRGWSRGRDLAWMLLMLVALVVAYPARGEVWGYVDEAGHAHVAASKLDDRYQLFFRGDAPQEPATPAQETAVTPRPEPPAVPVTRFETLIERHATRHQVDPALVKAIVAVESGFQPGAVSPKGARGLMQVMPGTAARYGVTGDRKTSAEQKLMDPAVNLQVGTRYLRDLLARFAQDVTLALAAYNAGEMAVERHRNRVPPYPETIEYVRRVEQLYAAFRPAAKPEPIAPVAGSSRVRGTLQPRAPAPTLLAPLIAAGTDALPQPVL